MTEPQTAQDDTATGLDLRVIVPGSEALDPIPRAIHVLTSGYISIECPDPLPPVPVTAGATLPFRPLRILPGTTASVLALY